MSRASMTPGEMFECLHALFMAEFERRHHRKPAVADLVRIIGKHGDRKDNTIYGRYLSGKRPPPRIEEMQRMCAKWTDAGYRGVEVRLSLVLDESTPIPDRAAG